MRYIVLSREILWLMDDRDERFGENYQPVTKVIEEKAAIEIATQFLKARGVDVAGFAESRYLPQQRIWTCCFFNKMPTDAVDSPGLTIVDVDSSTGEASFLEAQARKRPRWPRPGPTAGHAPLPQTLTHEQLFRRISTDKLRQLTIGCHQHQSLENTGKRCIFRGLVNKDKKQT
jgi:hypothetical protein